MSEYLFRGRRLEDKRWVYGYLCTSINYIGDANPKLSIQEGGYFRQVDPATVGQFINRTDNKQQKLFNGDKVLFNYGRHYNEPKGLTRFGTIVYDKRDCAFAVSIDNSAVLVKFWDIARIEIIGTIHDGEVTP